MFFVINYLWGIVVNKILFSLLLAGVSFGGIQAVNAGRTLKVEDNTNQKVRSLRAIYKKPLSMEEKGYIPTGPAKKGSHQARFLIEKVKKDPVNFCIGEDGTIWEKKVKSNVPTKLKSINEGIHVSSDSLVEGNAYINQNAPFSTVVGEQPTNIPMVIVTFHD